MKLLLDENLPVKLKYRFIEAGFEAYTVKDNNWLSKQNGELISLLIEQKFSTLITIDNNLSYQQNHHKYSIQIVVLVSPDNTYETIMSFFQDIVIALKQNENKFIAIIHPQLK